MNTYDKTANIFDPVSDTLDQRVFDGITPKPTIVRFITKVFGKGFQQEFGVPFNGFAHLFLTGSLTTYQYGDSSDCDNSVFFNWERFEKELGLDPKAARRQGIQMSIDYLDGTFLPGGSHPLQFFIVPFGILPTDQFQKGIRSGWDYDEHKWLVPPEKDRVHKIDVEFPEIYARAAAIGDKLTQMLDAKDYDAALDYWVQIHKKRQLDQQNGGGDFSEGNIDLKYLLHSGIIDRMRNELDLTEYQLDAYQPPKVGGLTPNWKIAMPPARMAPQFLEDYKSVPFDQEMGQGMEGLGIDVRGFDWVVDSNAISKLTRLPNFPLKNILVTIMRPYQSGWKDNFGEYDRGRIRLHPLQDINQASFTLWHEIQHQYQDQEDRLDLTNYNNIPGEDRDLSQYEKHPIEIDANEFAEYMKKVSLVQPNEPYYNPEWVPEELHLDRGEWDTGTETFQLTPERMKLELDAMVKMFRTNHSMWASMWQPGDYDRYGANHKLRDLITLKVLYNFESDHIILGTQADAKQLPAALILGEYDGHDSVTLYHTDKQWLNANYFKRLWAFSFPKKPLEHVYFQEGQQDDQKLHLPTRPVRHKHHASEDSKLNKLISEFSGHFVEHVSGRFGIEDMKDPKKSRGMCNYVAKEFVKAAQAEGIEAWLSEKGSTADDFGYQDRTIPGYDAHWWPIVKDGDQTYGIDFTASQYGYDAFPVIKRWDGEAWKS